jgi:hypothetical protein
MGLPKLLNPNHNKKLLVFCKNDFLLHLTLGIKSFNCKRIKK